MRKIFVDFLKQRIAIDSSIILITADLGYGLFDEIRDEYPNNFVNCGASEQLMIGLCVGAAYEGRLAVAYSITPFLLYRPFELIRNYVDKESLNIKLVGSGRGRDYSHDGFSHWAEDDEEIVCSSFKNITPHWPEIDTINTTLAKCFDHKGPCYINLKR